MLRYRKIWGQDPLPSIKLYEFVESPDNIINYSGCKDGLINEVDWFTVRAKVKKHDPKPNANVDTTLYLSASNDPSGNRWSIQCRPNINICWSYLNNDCYCEREDEDGYYHLVMNIKAKSLYSGGALMMAWRFESLPYHQLVISKVGYYPGTISDQKEVTLKIGSTTLKLDSDPGSDKYRSFPLDYTPDMTHATFCVYNLRPNSFIEIKEKGSTSVHTTTDPCVTIDFFDQIQIRVLTMSFTESGGCERKGLYVLRISPAEADVGLADWVIALIVIIGVIIVTATGSGVVYQFICKRNKASCNIHNFCNNCNICSCNNKVDNDPSDSISAPPLETITRVTTINWEGTYYERSTRLLY